MPGSFPSLRLHRKRSSPWMRSLCRETLLSVDDLVMPLFVWEGAKDAECNGLPHMTRYSIDGLVKVAERVVSLGIKAVVLFPAVDHSLKTVFGEEAFNPDNLICRAIAAIKNSVKGLGVISDVALDPYLINGHDGLTDANGVIMNDKTLSVLCKQAVVLAAAGCDVVAPSDMMDGRILAIRNVLDKSGFFHIPILSYAVKYCSAFYGPFRSAVGSTVNDAGVANSDNKTNSGGLIDKSTYQMDIANIKESLCEVEQDISEGADFIMVKPGGYFLDVIHKISNTVSLPVFAYQVSGEYAMIVSAAERGFLDYRKALLETAISFKRAGASAIFTYAALDLAEML